MIELRPGLYSTGRIFGVSVASKAYCLLFSKTDFDPLKSGFSQLTTNLRCRDLRLVNF